MSIERVIEDIRKLEAERTKYKKQLEAVKTYLKKIRKNHTQSLIHGEENIVMNIEKILGQGA